MKRDGGLAVGLLAVLALVGVSNLPNRSSEPSAPAAAGSPAAEPAGTSKPVSSQPSRPCTEIANRLKRMVKDTGKRVELWRFPDSCYNPDKPPTPNEFARFAPVSAVPRVRFAIATLPNPVTTHLPLMFDRLVETIQQAAQDDKYSYDSSWFPWEATNTTFARLADQLAQQDLQDIQQAQPGVIVFRRSLGESEEPYEGGLVVFVIGEQPTGGIDDVQFENALDWVARLGGLPDRELRILGPTFSGSIPSLWRELERRKDGYEKARVSSGTVSSSDSYRKFRNSLRDRGSSFRTAMESDTLMTDRFLKYLKEQKYDEKYVAFLSEDETAYGGQADTAASLPVRLYYPRDIATLRSAYEQQSIFNPPKSDTNTGAPSTTLRGDLSEPDGNNHDTVRSYGGQLTPLAQESVLLDIANRLSQKHIQFIILRSTSSLDQIFLSQFLRRAYPEGRVVIDGDDLLFSRGADGKSLRGVMLLSTYPLLTWEQDWTASLVADRGKGYRTFGEDAAEGVYIAARELFRDPPAGSDVPVRDYGQPAWAANTETEENQLPTTWLSVVARRQFWPLAALNANTLRGSGRTENLLPFPAVAKQPGDANPLSPPTSMWMFLIACFAWSSIHWYFCANGSIMGSPRARAYFAPVPRWQHPALIALGSLFLAMLWCAVAAGSGLSLPTAFDSRWHWVFVLAFLLYGLVAAFLALRGNYALEPVRASGSPLPDTVKWQRRTRRNAVICLALFVCVQVVYLDRHLTQANRIPAYLRSINLTSGVSALLPVILLLSGAYLWFWFNLRGLAHFGDDRPVLPRRDDLPPLMQNLSEELAGAPIGKDALPLSGLARLILTFLATGIVCGIALGDPYVRTLGDLHYGVVIFVLVCLGIAEILSDGILMWRTWNELRRLLVLLDRLPLRRTLRDLKGLAWGSVWKMSGNVLQERYRLISLQIESLSHLAAMLEADDYSRHTVLLSEIAARRENAIAFAQWFANLPRDGPLADVTTLCLFQAELASIAANVMKEILLPEWRCETDSLLLARPEREGGDVQAGADVGEGDVKPLVRAAEEFFVLPYVAFVRNIIGRIRTIILGMLCLFVATTLAVSSYPFEPLNALGAIFLTVFVLIGGLTALVYSQMSRDATLSHMTDTKPGQLGGDFWLRLAGFGIGPLIGLLTTLFPSISDFVFSWLEPGVQALR